MTKTLARPYFENSYDAQRCWVDIKEVETASFEDLEKAGWGYDWMGLEVVGENDNGENILKSLNDDFEGEKTWDEISDITISGFFSVSYWDGNNWNVDVFENYDTEEVEIEELDLPSPAYYFPYILILEDGEKVKCSCSNMSGSLSPYYYEDEDFNI